MEHRRFLDHSEAHRPFGGALFRRIGGRAAVEALVDGLYDRIEGDRTLRPLFGHDLTTERESQERFFSEWLGGDAEYTARAYLPLKLAPRILALYTTSRLTAHPRQSGRAARNSILSTSTCSSSG